MTDEEEKWMSRGYLFLVGTLLAISVCLWSYVNVCPGDIGDTWQVGEPEIYIERSAPEEEEECR